VPTRGEINFPVDRALIDQAAEVYPAETAGEFLSRARRRKHKKVFRPKGLIFEKYSDDGQNEGQIHGNNKRIVPESRFSVLFECDFAVLIRIFREQQLQQKAVDFHTVFGNKRYDHHRRDNSPENEEKRQN
jgi:hypothetical protein